MSIPALRHQFNISSIASTCHEFPFECSSISTVSLELNGIKSKKVLNIMFLVNIAILFGDLPAQETKHVGCIEIECDPQAVVRDAYDNARWLCDQYYLGAPELEIIEHNGEFIW